MAGLRNPRHEHFCRLVAAGQSPAQAYVAAGYSGETAYTSGPRLLKVPAVKTRVSELRQVVAKGAIESAEIDREFVLRELTDNALRAKEQQQWSASNRALELLGKELGMFGDAEVPWNGDPDTLAPTQREMVVDYILRLAVGNDSAKVAELKWQLTEQARAANDGKPYSGTNPTTPAHLTPALLEGHVEQIANGHHPEDPSSSAV